MKLIDVLEDAADTARAHGEYRYAQTVENAKVAAAELIAASSWYAFGGVRPAKEWAEANKRLRNALAGVQT